jgi:type I site-specific restriction endonuclease
MTNSNEAFSRVVIDAQLADQGWNTQDRNSVRYEYVLVDNSRDDYVLCDRHGHAAAVIEAKSFSISPGYAAEQAKDYARQLGVTYIFLANGKEILFWEWEREAFPRSAKTFFKQTDLAMCCGPDALPGRKANHHHDAAKHDQHLWRIFGRVFRSDYQRRVSPEHLRAVEQSSETF